MYSDDGKVKFLFKVSKRAQPQNTEMKRIGSNTPLFRGSSEQEDVASLLGGTVAVVDSEVNGDASAEEEATDTADAAQQKESLRPAVHMDAMAFGMLLFADYFSSKGRGRKPFHL
jgi:hypothetical protein